MSNFECSQLFNRCIGNAQGDPNHPDWDALLKQFLLIQEEFHELATAIATQDLHELRDGAADLLETTYGLFHRAGFDANADYEAVYNSNMSKFCQTLEEAQATQDQYAAGGVNSTQRLCEGYYAVVSSCDQTDVEGRFSPKGKLLKSINFHLPQFDYE